MKRATVLATLFTVTAFLSLIHSAQTSARQSGAPGKIPSTRENFDLRADRRMTLDEPPVVESPTARQQLSWRGAERGESRIQREHPGVQLKWSSLSGAPSRLLSFSQSLTAPSNADPALVARRFLRTNSDLFQLSDEEVNGLRVARRYRTERDGQTVMTHVTLGQQVNGIEIFQAEYAVHLDRTGAVLAASGELLPDAAANVNAASPRLTAEQALRIAAREAGENLTAPLKLRAQPAGIDQKQEFDRAAGFGDHVPARLAYFPLSSKEIRLAWQFTLTMRETPDMYFVMIDAERGSLLFLRNLTCYDENPLKPHGPVYTKESPRPNSPRTGTNPAEVQREDLPFRPTPYNGTAIFEVSNPHYDWWAGAMGNTTSSNNTNTYLDRDANNMPDTLAAAPADGNFNFPVDLTAAPTTEDNQKAAMANLFYWINRYHDILYSFGFNEAAGNFQNNNFNLGGVGADAIRGEAQDGAGTNNANFSTPADGGPGRVQMYLWTNSTPQRDGDFDQGVVIHELTHGLSNRLIGNGTGLGLTQDRGMGEGWSDWFGLALLAQESDNINGEYAVGQWVVNNFTRGIRRFPYSTDKAIYPYTYKDVRLNTEVHAVGEIWCNALWEMRAALIQKYGFKEGQRQSIQLVVDGMKLSPIVPTFVDARNAIILADRAGNNGANQCLLWEAFSKRGLGFRARTNDAADGAPVESLDSAPYCSDAGILAIDKTRYVGGESLALTLGDRNAAGAVAVQVTSSATGDSETLRLAPESGIAGSYLGALKIATGRAAPNDGVLQGSADRQDEIAVVYNDPNNGSGAPAQIKVAAAFTREKTVFEDSVETGNQGWIANGLWATTNSRAASGLRSWTDSPAGNYANSVNTSLTSPLFDLTGFGEVSLNFAHSFDTENRWDFAVVEYSIDDGATWTRAAAFTGRQTAFAQSRVSLRALDGQRRARVRFRLFADPNEVGDGWYIDDIRLLGRANNAALIPPGSTPAPVIASVSPAFGPPAGAARVTINGSGFTETETTAVSFDGIPATSFSVISGNVISALTPAHGAGTVTVRVLNRNGGAGLQNGFTYHTPGSGGAAPAITTIFPNAGSTRGGTVATVIGANFTPETEFFFGAAKGAATFINANALRVLTPAATAAGAVEIAAANGALRATMANGFSYTAASPPAVQLLSLNGGETVFARGVVNINWRSSDNRAVARHRVVLVRGAALTDIAADLPGSDQSYSWVVPNNLPSPTQARIRVIAADDEGAESEALSSAEFTIAQRWETQSQLPASLQRLQIASDGRSIYSFGGRTSTTTSTTTVTTGYRLDTTIQQPVWNTAVAAMPTGLNGGEAVFLKGKIHIPGGVNVSAALTAQHLAYDTAANSWATVKAVPTAVFLYALAADESRGVFYLTGGSNGSASTATLRSYDPAADAWNDLPAMGAARSNHEAALIEGRLYVAGGTGAAGGLTSAEVYDFNTQRWTPIAPLNRPRSGATNFAGKDAYGNSLWFIIGGQDAETGAFLGAEVYDILSNRWLRLDDSFALNLPRGLLGGATAGEYFYAVGGSTTASVRNAERTRINNLTLIPLNQAPVVAVPATQIAAAGVELQFTVSANDLGSGAPVQISAAGLPSGANFTTESSGANSTRATFRWTPGAGAAGQSFTVTFTASDNQLRYRLKNSG